MLNFAKFKGCLHSPRRLNMRKACLLLSMTLSLFAASFSYAQPYDAGNAYGGGPYEAVHSQNGPYDAVQSQNGDDGIAYNDGNVGCPPPEKPVGDCYCLYCRYEPCYYNKWHCNYVPKYCYKKCCRYVPQYYQKKCCRYVPQYYYETC